MKKLQGEEIKLLIPQRYPMIMVDEFESGEDDSATTTLSVRTDNMFCYGSGEMAPTGLIEHIAQSMSCLAGFKALEANVSEPPVGIIGEVKHFTCSRYPRANEKISTTVRFTMTFGNVTIAEGKSHIGEELIAEAKMKIFIE